MRSNNFKKLTSTCFKDTMSPSTSLMQTNDMQTPNMPNLLFMKLFIKSYGSSFNRYLNSNLTFLKLFEHAFFFKFPYSWFWQPASLCIARFSWHELPQHSPETASECRPLADETPFLQTSPPPWCSAASLWKKNY